MKLSHVTLVIAAFICIAATILVSPAIEQDAESVQWRQLLQQDVSVFAAERGPLDGAHGASATGFRVSSTVRGGAMIVALDRPVLGVFVGLNTPNEFINEPCNDLRVEFTLADGSARVVKPAGGGGTAMLFQSPDDVPMSSLRKVALYVDAHAKWAR